MKGEHGQVGEHPLDLLLVRGNFIQDDLLARRLGGAQGDKVRLVIEFFPYRRQALELIRAEVPHVDMFVAVSQYCADLMQRYLEIPAAKLRVAPEILVGILDDLSVRSDRLQAELRELSATRDRLRSGSAGAEAALAEALFAGRLAGAVLDVFQREPLPPDHIFWRTPNLLITSHTAAPSFPADITALFVENYHRYLRGEPLRYQVSFSLGY